MPEVPLDPWWEEVIDYNGFYVSSDVFVCEHCLIKEIQLRQLIQNVHKIRESVTTNVRNTNEKCLIEPKVDWPVPEIET